MESRGKSHLVVSAGNSNSSNQPSPGAQPHSSPHPPQPVIGMNPATGPAVGALPAVQQVQAAPHMVAASVNYVNGNPVVSPATANAGLMLTTPQMQIPVLQMMSGEPNHILIISKVTCLEGSGYAQNLQPHQNPQPQPAPQMELRQETHLIELPGNRPSSIGNSSMGSFRVIPNPGASLGGIQIPTPAKEQLIHLLKSPPAAKQKQQVMAILNSNPPLMDEYIKQRTAYQQHLNSSNQPSPGAQLHSSPHPPQPVIGMNPATGSPVGVLQAVAARQTTPHMVAASVNNGKGNPVVSPATANAGLMLTTPQMQIPVSQMMPGVSNPMLNMNDVTCEGSGYAPNPQHTPQTEKAEPQAECPVPLCDGIRNKLRPQKKGVKQWYILACCADESCTRNNS